MIDAGFSSPVRSLQYSLWTVNVCLSSQTHQSTLCMVYALFYGFREGNVGDYLPSAACFSPTSSSRRVEIVADKALFLVASLLGLLPGGIARLALAAEANSSRSSSSPSRLKVGLRWHSWMVAKLFASVSRSKRASGCFSAAHLEVFFPSSLIFKALLYQVACPKSSRASSCSFSWGMRGVCVLGSHS